MTTKQKGPGKPKHIPTEVQLAKVKELAGLGIRHVDIASIIGISRATLELRYRDELDIGGAVARAKVAQTAYQMALSGDSASMTTFYMKTQCGWRETDHHVHTGEDGGAIQHGLSVEFVGLDDPANDD